MSAIALLVTACTKDETLEPNVTPAVVGDEIQFGSRAGFENPTKTRTVYSGDFYTKDGKNFERIDWVTGMDAVEVYCSEAGGVNPAHYTVTQQSVSPDGTTSGNPDGDTHDEGYLTKIGDGALQWGTATTHNFYAMYPSSQMKNISLNNTLAQGIKMDGAKLTGIVPIAQQASEIVAPTDGNKTYYAKPDMTYAYMAAKSTATRDDGSVSLDFVPVVAALEVELQAQNTAVTIEYVMIEGPGVAGTFTADLSEWDGTGYPTCVNVSDDNEADQILFSLGQEITLQAGESLIFTVFLRPNAGITEQGVVVPHKNVTVGFSPTGAGYLKNMLGNNTNAVELPPHAKTVVRDFLLPKTEEELVIDASKWMEQLDNKMSMARLSLPGAGGAFTSAYSDADYVQQSLGFLDLWKAGVRAFEVSTDRCGDEPTSHTDAEDLGDLNVMCNGENLTGIILRDVVCDLVDKVSSGTETAMLILTYQPPGGVGSNNRNGGYYARNLRKFYETLTGGTVVTDGGITVSENHFVLYKPSTILGSKENADDARGKVMIIARPTQEDETDNFGSATDTWDAIKTALDGTKILALNGCGTAKDRWGKRGYVVRGEEALDIVPFGQSFTTSIPCVEYYLTQTGSGFSWSWPDYAANVTRPADKGADFSYPTDEGYTCYYQDWARVVSLDYISEAGGDVSSGFYHIKNTGLGLLDIYADYRWYESLQEKKDCVAQTFGLALASKPENNVVYINSLCGYLVDPGIADSYTPFPDTWGSAGSTGNIGALASIMNDYLDSIVTDAGLAQETGPTGIVLMDFVTANSSAVGAIVANNFKHSLQ